MSTFSKLLILTLALSFTFLASCKKSKTYTNHTVEYKIIASATASISTVIHTNNQGDVTTLTEISSKTWSSGKINVSSSVGVLSVGANGISTSPDGTLTVQIYVDGELQKENIAQGTILSASSTYQF